MLSRAQAVLVLSLLAWLLVLFKLFSLRAEANAKARLALQEGGQQVDLPGMDFKKGNSSHERTGSESESKPSPVTANHSPSSSRPAKNKVKQRRTWQDYKTDASWMDFVHFPHDPLEKMAAPKEELSRTCSKEVVDRLDSRLSADQLQWCQWALSDSGGKVKVGKSYGKLGPKDQNQYEKWNCNAVAKGMNPSCNDAWGDNHILNWKRNEIANLCGDENAYTSRVHCKDSSNQARFCTFENVLVDLRKMHNVKRPGRTDSRRWDRGFLTTHCGAEKRDINYYEFYDSSVRPPTKKCDFVMNETVVMYGHDDIRNLGHSMSDFMNVLTMLWLSDLASAVHSLTFLNADAIRQGHNYYDDLGAFITHYSTQFGRVLKLSSFPSEAKICVKRLVFMPRPVVLYTWDGWWQDMPCSFAGPSSLYQRWNFQMRQGYGLVQQNNTTLVSSEIEILLLERKARGGSSQQASRLMKNFAQVRQALSSLPGVRVTALDMSTLPFPQQVAKLASSHLLVGMHGAGIASAMHMSIGMPNCCGVIEIFPQGEFMPIRGYGNMARRMGLHYQRLELSGGQSHGDGAVVPTDALISLTSKVIRNMKGAPTCVVPSVLSDPYLEGVVDAS